MTFCLPESSPRLGATNLVPGRARLAQTGSPQRDTIWSVAPQWPILPERAVLLAPCRVIVFFQRPDTELGVRRFAIALLKLGQEKWALLLRSCFAHDLAAVQRLTLAGWFSGRAVR